MPVMVTVCGVLQFAAVKIRLLRAIVPSVVSSDVMGSVTSAVGSAVSTTVKDAVVPLSEDVKPVVGETTKPSTVVSVFVAVTSLGFRPL